VRLFGGWGYQKDLVNASDWVKQSYAGGVPMGADLPPMPSDGKGAAPHLVVWALKDPTSANLDRVQIIKGWTKNGQSFEKIYDVAWSGDRAPDKWTGRVPAIQSTVDLEHATYSNSVGATELKAVWTDPDFDASLHAFYYVRVLEIPTPRWTLIQSVKAGLPPPDVVPLTGQERAWTSPIWYTPSAPARKDAQAGVTIADLKNKGAVVVNEAQLKQLISGKALWLRNTVTGEQFWQSFTAEGQTTIFRVGSNAEFPSGFGAVAQDGYKGLTSPYKIEGGKLITFLSQDPYSVLATIKGERPADGSIPADEVQVDFIAPPEASLLLLRDDFWSMWVAVGAASIEHAGWLGQIARGKPASLMSDADWRDRVTLMLPYLENSEPLAAKIAYGELAAAPYAALLAAIRRWLADPALAARRPVYFLLLGAAGDPQDAATLERQLEAAWTAGDATSLGSLIAADLQLRGPSRMAWVDTKYLGDRLRSTKELEAALLALGVLGGANAAIPRQRVVQCYMSFIRARPELAGLVASDLAAWGVWDAAPIYRAIVASNQRQSFASQIAMGKYLAQSPAIPASSQ
jgi:hypothetical protein